jgi:hypothetical protein
LSDPGDTKRLDWMEAHDVQLGWGIRDDNGTRRRAVFFVDPCAGFERYGEGETLREAVDDAMKMTGDLD